MFWALLCNHDGPQNLQPAFLGLIPWLPHFLFRWLRNYLVSLCLSFLLWKMGRNTGLWELNIGHLGRGWGELMIVITIISKLLMNSIVDEVNTQCFPNIFSFLFKIRSTFKLSKIINLKIEISRIIFFSFSL